MVASLNPSFNLGNDLGKIDKRWNYFYIGEIFSDKVNVKSGGLIVEASPDEDPSLNAVRFNNNNIYIRYNRNEKLKALGNGGNELNSILDKIDSDLQDTSDDLNTFKLKAVRIFRQIEDPYWNDPRGIDNFNEIDPASFHKTDNSDESYPLKDGEVFLDLQNRNLLFFVSNITPYKLAKVFSDANPNIDPANIPNYCAYIQPSVWENANSLAGFLVLSLGFNKDDFATKVFVTSTVNSAITLAISSLIDGAPEALDTLKEIAEAIGNNPDAWEALNTLINVLNADTYRKNETYTQVQVNNLLDELKLNSSTKPWDYIVGGDSEHGEFDNISNVYINIAALNNLNPTQSISNIKTILIKPDVPDGGLYNSESETLQISIGNICHQSLFKNANNYIKFKKIEVDISDSIYENSEIIFENLQLEQIKILDTNGLQKPYTIKIINSVITNSTNSKLIINDEDGNPNVKIEIINSKIKNNFNNNALFIKKGKVLIENSEVSYLNENSGVDVISIWQHNENEETTYCEINNSKIYGVCQVNNSAKLKIRNSLILNASDTYNGPLLYSSDTDSILDLQEVHFLKKYNQDSADIHIAGPGKCYVDHNIYEISFLKDENGDLVLDSDGKPFAREVGFESLLNGGKGITTEFFYKPLGYSLFFYDDERARDAIAISLNSSYLNEQTTSGQEDFTFQNEAGYENYPHNPKGIEFKHYENKNKIGLDISHVDVHDLAEGTQIAFKNEENNFTLQQHFIQGFKSYNNVNIGDPDLDENGDARISNVSIKSQGLNNNDLPNLFELKGDFIEISRNDNNLQQYNFEEPKNTYLIYDSDNSTPLTDPPLYKYLPTFRFNDNIWTSIKDPEFPLNIANKNYVDAEILDIFTRLNNLKLDDIIDVNTTGWLRNPITGHILLDDNTGDKLRATTLDGMILSYGPHEINDLDYSPGKMEDWHPKFINARPAFLTSGAPINNTPFVGTYLLDNIQNTYYSIHNQDWYDIIYNTDSVFRLRGINPLDTTQMGHIENGVGSSSDDYWNANEYSLFWNGLTTNQKSDNQKLHPTNNEPVHTAQEFDGNGEYSPVPIQSKIRLAKNYIYHQTDSSLQHDGSGKVYIAKTNEVKFGNQLGSYTYNARNRLGDSVTIYDDYHTPTNMGYAVRPDDLFAAYARRDMTNLTRAALGATNEEGLILRHEDEVNYARWNLGFKTNFDENSDSVYLKYDRASDEYLSTDATFQYYQYTQILPGSEISSIVNSALDPELTPWNPLIANLNRYYMVTCDIDVNNRNLIILPAITSSTSGRSIVIKKENAAGKLIIRTDNSSERLLLQDGVTILPDDNGIVQIDIDNMGHVIKFMSNGNSGDPYWIVEGFYGNGGVGFDVEANKEVIQDVIVAPLFIHDPTQPVTHDDAISFVYDATADTNDRIIAKINFATQEEVDDGTLTNKPIAPDTYKKNLGWTPPPSSWSSFRCFCRLAAPWGLIWCTLVWWRLSTA